MTSEFMEQRSLHLTQQRAKREIEVLANIAPAMRQGMLLAAELGITRQSFAEPDTSAIFLAFTFGIQSPNRGTRARLARRSLELVNLWDDSDTRSFISGVRWGPGSLAVLFTRMEYDPGRLALAIANLLDVVEQVNELARKFGRAA